MMSTRSLRNPVVVLAGLAFAAVLAWLAFGYFGVQTLFTDDKVDEAMPEFASGAGAAGVDAEPSADGAGEVPDPAVDEAAADPFADGSPVVATTASGVFVDRSHPTSGDALVLSDGTDQRFLRFENFETDNGPDLNVYLSTAPADASADEFDDDFIDLGALSGNIGDQNYELPPDVDLTRYRTVVIWCVRFGVAFGAADLA